MNALIEKLEGGVIVKKFNPYEAYSLGKNVFPILRLENKNYKFSEVMMPLYFARMSLQTQINEKTIFERASCRAAEEAVQAISSIIPIKFDDIIAADSDKLIQNYEIQYVKNILDNLETVLKNDMPGVAAYVVSKKGIYNTEDLISHADNVFPPEIRTDIPQQAIKDFLEAGKCLAYEVPTACAFHLWRAVESVMGKYYTKLTKSTFQADNVTPNWSIYVKALNNKGANEDITKFLDHIRESYRNPQTHPEDMLAVNEALGLFGVATSAIQMMVLEIQKS